MSEIEYSDDPEQIEGKVSQILSPEEQSRYAIGEKFRKVAEGKYIVVLRTPEAPGRLGRVKNWFQGRPDWAPVVVCEEVDFEEGDHITVEGTQLVFREVLDEAYHATEVDS